MKSYLEKCKSTLIELTELKMKFNTVLDINELHIQSTKSSIDSQIKKMLLTHSSISDVKIPVLFEDIFEEKTQEPFKEVDIDSCLKTYFASKIEFHEENEKLKRLQHALSIHTEYHDECQHLEMNQVDFSILNSKRPGAVSRVFKTDAHKNYEYAKLISKAWNNCEEEHEFAPELFLISKENLEKNIADQESKITGLLNIMKITGVSISLDIESHSKKLENETSSDIYFSELKREILKGPARATEMCDRLSSTIDQKEKLINTVSHLDMIKSHNAELKWISSQIFSSESAIRFSANIFDSNNQSLETLDIREIKDSINSAIKYGLNFDSVTNMSGPVMDAETRVKSLKIEYFI